MSTDKSSDILRDEVREFLREHRVSARALSLKAGLNINYVSHFLATDRVPSVDNADDLWVAMSKIAEGDTD